MERRPVSLLPPLVAQRIAAGEVIERPHSVVRELMDNAVDSGASSVDVYLESGGIDSIRVIDNGYGMTRDDLALCCASHATSKITSLEDLDRLETLGFRVEALSSMAACADLTITSGTREGSSHILKVKSGEEPVITPGGSSHGSTVEVRRLFHEIPGRKKFLKSPRAEGASCRKVFLDKSLPFTNISFRLFADGNLKLFLPKSSLKQRVLQAYSQVLNESFIYDLPCQSGPVQFHAVLSSPAFYRTDRSYIQVFVNKRRVSEYSLVQAVTHAYSGVLPGGAFPYCFLFLELPADTVDFNIHPAKQEVRLRGQREVHHHITTTLRDWLNAPPEQEGRPAEITQESNELFARESGLRRQSSRPRTPPPRQWYQSLQTMQEAPPAEPREEQDDFYYFGQVFNLFLLAQREDSLYLIDQHAAHERIIYEQLKSSEALQPLLIPLSMTVEEEIHRFLSSHGDLYRDIGIMVEHQQDTT